MRVWQRVVLLAVPIVGLFYSGGEARAGFISGSLWVNQPGAAGNATLGQQALLGTADAQFNSGAFNYDSNVGGYTIGGFLNNPAFTNTSANFTTNGGAGANLNNTVFFRQA
jgi:hypothetical protein